MSSLNFKICKQQRMWNSQHTHKTQILVFINDEKFEGKTVRFRVILQVSFRSFQTAIMMRSQDDTSIVMKGGRKFRRLPMHVSMHVENEASGEETYLR